MFSAAEAERVLRIPAATVRSWARREQIHPYGLDDRDRPMYDRDDLVRLRDKGRSSAYNEDEDRASVAAGTATEAAD